MSIQVTQLWQRSIKVGNATFAPDFDGPPIGQIGMNYLIPNKFHRITGWQYSFTSSGVTMAAARVLFYQGSYFDNKNVGSLFPLFGRVYSNPPINGAPVFLDLFYMGNQNPPMIAFDRKQYLDYDGQLAILVCAPIDSTNNQTTIQSSFTLFGYED